jgi:hypothetical protein
VASKRVWQHAKYLYVAGQSFAHNSANFKKTFNAVSCTHVFEFMIRFRGVEQKLCYHPERWLGELLSEDDEEGDEEEQEEEEEEQSESAEAESSEAGPDGEERFNEEWFNEEWVSADEDDEDGEQTEDSEEDSSEGQEWSTYLSSTEVFGNCLLEQPSNQICVAIFRIGCGPLTR